MRNDISPTCCLPFESECVKTLHWLPLAVRHKLDCARLHLKLEQWQDLPQQSRIELLERLPCDGFEIEAKKAGARVTAGLNSAQQEISEVDVSRLLGCTWAEGRAWLEGATPFARYTIGKQIRLQGQR